jgi:hypothetical protein
MDPRLRAEPIGPRSTSDYQHLLSPEEADEVRSEKKPDQPDLRVKKAVDRRIERLRL